VARLHRSPVYLERHAVLASRSDPSGALDGLSRCHPVLPDDKRSQANIPGPDQIGMERNMALLAHKEQAGPRAIPFARVATAWTALTGVVGIHLDAQGTSQCGFVKMVLHRARQPRILGSVKATGTRMKARGVRANRLTS
jgi:hypothetical protein